MGDFSSYIPSIVVVTILFGMLVWRVVGTRRADHVRRQGTIARGWGYRKVGAPYSTRHEFKGWTSNRSPWLLESVITRPSLSNNFSNLTFTRWFTDAISRPDHVMLVGPSFPNTPPDADWIQFMLRAMLRAIPDLKAGDEPRPAGMEKVPVGSESFRQRYLVFATDASYAGHLLGGEAEASLIDWATREERVTHLPAILHWHRGLQIKLDDDFSANMDILDRLVTLGDTLMRGMNDG